MMRIAVLGAGAMGSLFGGLLAEAGNDVELLDVNAAQIAAIRSSGLVLDTDRGKRTIQMKICRPDEAGRSPDWIIVFTKTLNTRAALATIGSSIGPQTRLLSLQNGLGNARILAEFAPFERVAIGVTTVPADLVVPGSVRSHGRGYVRMMMADSRSDAGLFALAAAMCGADIDTTVELGVEAAIWEKVAFNAALNSLCATIGCSVGELGAMPEGRALAHAIASETLAVARSQGIAVADTVHLTLDHAMDHHHDHKPSMLQDLLAGRPTEIDSINGGVVLAARAVGGSAPITGALHALVRLRERYRRT